MSDWKSKVAKAADKVTSKAVDSTNSGLKYISTKASKGKSDTPTGKTIDSSEVRAATESAARKMTPGDSAAVAASPAGKTNTSTSSLTPADSVSEPQPKIDNIEKTPSVPVAELSAHENLLTFYSKNEQSINSAANAVASARSQDGKSNAINIAIIRSKETSKVLIEGLDALERVHPFVGVAVAAFKGVTTLGMRQAGNNSKAEVVMIHMQDMMSVLFQLRDIRDGEVRGPDGTTLKENMLALMPSIAALIESCGNACEVYRSKKFLARTLKSRDYEERFTKFVTAFYDYKQQIGVVLAMHTTPAPEAANIDGRVNDVMKIREVADKIFRKLDTPPERKVLAFIQDHGDVKECITDEATLDVLVSLTGKSLASFDPTRMGNPERGSESLKTELIKELEEDIDKALEKHMPLFTAKLHLNQEQLTTRISAAEENIIQTLSGGEYKKVRDEDLHSLWLSQSWRGNVKARSFALALSYYFSDKFSVSGAAAVEGEGLWETGSVDDSDGQEVSAGDEDRWALQYLGVPHLQQIVEAADDDGAGYVSIHEVNEFARRRPEDWSLLQWVAFCAAGWHTSVTWYRTRIYKILDAMLTALEHVKPENLQATNKYLGGQAIQRVELLLRATHPTEQPALEGTPLRRITDEYQKRETTKFEQRLQQLDYDLENVATVQLVTRNRRVEHYVYPLLYLLLKRHFHILRQACMQTIEESKLTVMIQSILSIFAAVDTRKEKLRAIFKSHGQDIDERMSHFAFGMFHLTSAEHKRDPRNNTIRTFMEADAFKYRHEDLAINSDDEKAAQQGGVANPVSKIKFSFLRYCNHCYRSIDGTRIFCVQCMDDRWLETVDLCSGCFEKEVSHKGILHTMSHLMIETTRPIHDGEMAVLVPDAKQVARRVKREFKLLRVKPTCSSCNDPVALPCWVCMICDKDIYVCKACAAKRTSSFPNAPKHKVAHPLLWILDNRPIMDPRSEVTAATLATLGAKITAMEQNFERRFAALERSLNGSERI